MQSKRFGRFNDFFIPESKWQEMRKIFFKRAGFPSKAEHVGGFLTERLNRAFDHFLEQLSENSYVSMDEDTWHLSTDPAERLIRSSSTFPLCFARLPMNFSWHPVSSVPAPTNMLPSSFRRVMENRCIKLFICVVPIGFVSSVCCICAQPVLHFRSGYTSGYAGVKHQGRSGPNTRSNHIARETACCVNVAFRGSGSRWTFRARCLASPLAA